MKKINSFFWSCSGVNQSFLKRCPTEGSKYAGIGITILFTGLFASIAASYAINSVFDNMWYSAAFGLLWGAMIFNLDRYIVSSMNKTKRFSSEFLMASPRIILALLIAMVISKPLELKVFQKEINSELTVMEQEVLKNQEEQVRARYTREINTLQTEIDTLKKEITNKTALRDNLVELARQEADGTGGSMKRNPGPIYKIKKDNADKADKELQQLMSNLTPLINNKNNQIETLRKQTTADINALSQDPYNGFAAQIEALSRIKSKSEAIFWTDWFIFLLFIAIETAPIFVKLMSRKGPYDELLEAHEHLYKTKKVQLVATQSNNTKITNEHLSNTELEYLQHKLNSYLK